MFKNKIIPTIQFFLPGIFVLLLLAAALVLGMTLGKSSTENDVPVPAQRTLVVSYRRSGGFVRGDELWNIYSDGFVEGWDLRNKSQNATWSGNAGAQAVGGLLELVETEDFFSFKDHYIGRICCDLFTYQVQVFTGRGRQVTAIEGANAPEGFWRIVDEIDRITSSVK